MLNFIITAVAVALIVTFGLLNSVCAGFSYFAIFFFAAICIYWLYVLISSYIYHYKTKLDERYQLYCAGLVNNSTVTIEEIAKNNEVYVKQFKKTLRKEKAIEICKMIVVIGLLISIVSLFFTGELF